MSNLCPANQESVYFMRNANRGKANQYGDTYNPNWRNHPNFSWGENQGAQNQYRPQAPQQQYRPPQAEQHANSTSHLGEMMKKLMADQQAQTAKIMNKVMADQQAQAVTMRNLEVLEEVPKKKKYTASLEGELVPKTIEENKKENKGLEPIIVTRPPPLFPQLQKQKDDVKYKKFLDILCQMRVNLPLVEILQELPNYARYLRDIVADEEVPIILGGPFLAIDGAIIDVRAGKLKMRVDDEEVTFNVYKALKFPKHYEDFMITVVELKGTEQSSYVNYSDLDGKTKLEEVVLQAECVKMIEKRARDERGDLLRACKKARLRGRKKKRKRPA
ncbi:uncharacterized protein [Nicotiana tomentosiformis]|uniref:uncharacterized protein n=1 Tax=Nicotiana tomentosiformis TaxID=4098 RepID=UPI00388C8709